MFLFVLFVYFRFFYLISNDISVTVSLLHFKPICDRARLIWTPDNEKGCWAYLIYLHLYVVEGVVSRLIIHRLCTVIYERIARCRRSGLDQEYQTLVIY